MPQRSSHAVTGNGHVLPLRQTIRRMVISTPGRIHCTVWVKALQTTLFSEKRQSLPVCEPFQVIRVNRFVANRALAPLLIRQRQIMQHAWPAVNMSASCHFSGNRWMQADWTARFLVAVNSLKITFATSAVYQTPVNVFPRTTSSIFFHSTRMSGSTW